MFNLTYAILKELLGKEPLRVNPTNNGERQITRLKGLQSISDEM